MEETGKEVSQESSYKAVHHPDLHSSAFRRQEHMAAHVFKGNSAAEKLTTKKGFSETHRSPPRHDSAPVQLSTRPWQQAEHWGSGGTRGTDGWQVRTGTTGNMLHQTCQAHSGNHSIVNYMKPWKQNAVTKSSWAHSEISWPLDIIPITIPPFL